MMPRTKNNNMLETVSTWTFRMLIVVVILPVMSLAVACDSRFYCKTPEVKYISMDKLTNVALNGTVIKSVQSKDISGCQRSCLQEENCRSMNVNVSTAAGLTCDLLDVNIYSNASLLLQRNGSIHLYIPSKCHKNPCKNEAVCVPHYKNDSYQCECKSNGTWITSGVHCEKALRGYSTAFVYWSFNDLASSAPLTSTNTNVSSFTLEWKPVSEPGRKHPVVMCKDKASCIGIWKGIPCLNSFGKCKATVTYSIWIKYTEFEANRKRYTRLFTSYGSKTVTSISFYADLSGSFNFKAALSTSKRWDISSFGTSLVKTKWNQFTLTVDDNIGACAFINGVKQACQTTYTSVSFTHKSNNALIIGGAWYPDSEPYIYVDDFAVWQIAFSEEEVRDLYEQTKE